MKKIDKLKTLKAVVSAVVGLGTERLLRNIINNNTEIDGVYDRLTVGAGRLVVTVMIVDSTKAWTDARIDSLAAQYREYLAARQPNPEITD